MAVASSVRVVVLLYIPRVHLLRHLDISKSGLSKICGFVLLVVVLSNENILRQFVLTFFPLVFLALLELWVWQIGIFLYCPLMSSLSRYCFLVLIRRGLGLESKISLLNCARSLSKSSLYGG